MGPGPEKEDTPKNLDVPTPLAPREKIEGDLFGQAVMMLADPFVVNAICRSLSRKLEEVSTTWIWISPFFNSETTTIDMPDFLLSHRSPRLAVCQRTTLSSLPSSSCSISPCQLEAC